MNDFEKILYRKLEENKLDKKIALSIYKHIFYFIYKSINVLVGTHDFKKEEIALYFPKLFIIESKYRKNTKRMKRYASLHKPINNKILTNE